MENWHFDVWTIGSTSCHLLGKDTRIPIKFLSREDPARWNSTIHCERGNTSWHTGATRCQPSKRSKATAIYHWKRWNRNRIVSGIKIILKQGEWTSAKKTETIFECYRRRRKTFYDMVNVHVCNNGISSIHGKELAEQLSFHHEYKRSHTETNVRHIYKIGVWTRWDLWIGNHGKSFTRECHRKNHIHVDVQRLFLWIKRQWRRMPIECQTRFSVCKEIWKRTQSFIGPGSEKKWYCISEDSPQGERDNMAERMLLDFAESGCPIFRATSPLSRGRLKSNGHGKLSIHYTADLETTGTVFSHNCFCTSAQSSRSSRRYVCEEHETLHDTMGDKMITGPAFFISTFNFGKNNQDPAKDPEFQKNDHNDFPVWVNFGFFLA